MRPGRLFVRNLSCRRTGGTVSSPRVFPCSREQNAPTRRPYAAYASDGDALNAESTMFRAWSGRLQIVGFCLVAASFLVASSGCVGLVANLMNVAHGNLVPAQFKGLEERRVAVVCVSNSEAFGPTSASVALSKQVGKLLEQNVREISLIDPQAVADWIDENGWDYMDYVALGKGVDAEMLVAIDLDGFSLHEGRTLYKGRAEVSITVYDLLQSGKEVFATIPPQIQYPRNSGYHTTDLSEAAFRRQFLTIVSSQIARHFYAYDAKEDYARDVSLVGM